MSMSIVMVAEVDGSRDESSGGIGGVGGMGGGVVVKVAMVVVGALAMWQK